MSAPAAIMDATLNGPFISTPTIEVPATPHPQHAELPADANMADIPPSESIPPSSTQLIPNSSQKSDADLDSLLAPIPSSSKRSKYHSPTPPSSSMTPPPSTQPAKRAASPATKSEESRQITPTPAVTMSSPPATTLRSDTNIARGLHIPSLQQLQSASTTELLQLLTAAAHENSRLNASEKEARMSAAHCKLQHNLLELETEETVNRLEVEHEMMRREVEVLQQVELARRDSNHTHYSSPADAAADQQDKEATERYIADLKAYAEAMAKENAQLHRRFERAKKVIADREEEITQLTGDNKKLLDRIRQNREHIHLLTGQGGIYASPQSQNQSLSRTMPSTPNKKERDTPRQTPSSARHISHNQQMQNLHQMQMQNQQQLQHQRGHTEHGQQHRDSFATLLLADQVLNDQNSAPTTPRRATAHGMGHGHPTSSAVRHHRAAQSLSSLPIPQTVGMQPQYPLQPNHNQPMTQAPLLSPPQLGGPSPSQAQGYEYPSPYLPRISPRDRVRRRKSRDSTISASDEEERAQEILRISPQQAPTLQAADPSAGYAPAQRGMVQDIPRQGNVYQPRQHNGRLMESPHYERLEQRQAIQVDDDETEEEHPEEVESDIDIPASQASLSASAMLRRDPRESFEIAGSPRTQQSAYHGGLGVGQAPQQTEMYRGSLSSNVRAHPPLTAAGSVTEKGRVLQAKIFGSVTKPNAGIGMEGGEKRKRLPSEEEIRAKRLRGKAREGLGLGLEL